MGILSYDDIADFCYDVSCEYDELKDKDKNITIIAKYEETIEIIKELLDYDYNIHSISDLEPPEEGYLDEFIITISSIDKDYEIMVEPMACKGKYKFVESEIIYLLDNCSSKIIHHLDSDGICEVNIEDEDDYDHNEYEDDCECCCEENDECIMRPVETKNIILKPIFNCGNAIYTIENMADFFECMSDIFRMFNR